MRLDNLAFIASAGRADPSEQTGVAQRCWPLPRGRINGSTIATSQNRVMDRMKPYIRCPSGPVQHQSHRVADAGASSIRTCRSRTLFD
jgi:hypothetical protein